MRIAIMRAICAGQRLAWVCPIIAVALCQIGCHRSPVIPPLDQTTFIRGLVVDSVSALPIESVIVGWKMSSYPDSLLFPGDTLHLDSVVINMNVRDIHATDDSGRFSVAAFLAPMPPYPYEDMFAYKHGYLLWRFDSQRDHIIHLNEWTDSITIRLVERR
jgi:hypothetical protein